MATEAEEVLALAFEFLRATDLARGRRVSRGLGRRCGGIVEAGTRVEAVLCNTEDMDRMVEDACGALKVQCEPACVLVLHTRFSRCRLKTSDLVKELKERGVLPAKALVVRVQVYGLMGRTAAGHPLEIEEGPGVLLAVIPKAFAEVALDEDAFDLPGSEVSRRIDVVRRALGTGAGGNIAESDAQESSVEEDLFLASTVIVRDSPDVAERVDSDCVAPSNFGGVAQGKIFEVRDDCACDVCAVAIRWRRRPGSPQQRGLLGAHVQTMAAVPQRGPEEERRRQAEKMIESQKGDAARVLQGRPPQAVLAFACNARGRSWYGEPSVEVDLLYDAYCKNVPGAQRPAVFGMFCGGELGPLVDDGSDSESSGSQQGDGGNEQRAASACHWKVGAAASGGTAQRSELQGFCTVVAVLA